MNTGIPRQRSRLSCSLVPRGILDFLTRHFLPLLISSYLAIHAVYHHYHPPRLAEFSFWAGEAGSIATNIAMGKGFANPYPQIDTGPSAWVSPLYPYVLAAIFRIAGIKTSAAATLGLSLQVLIYAGTLWVLYRIVQRTFSTSCAQVATLIWLINPNRIGLTSRVLSGVGLTILTLLLTILALIHFKKAPTRNAAMLAGLAIGSAILCRPEMALAFPFYAYVLYGAVRRPPREAILAVACAFLACIAVVAPWTVRNYLVFRQLVFIKSNFGVQLHVGNSDLEQIDTQLIAAPHERSLMQRMGEIEFARYSRQRAIEWIRGHKMDFLVRCIRRGLAFWITNPARDWKRWVWSPYQVLLLGASAVGVWREGRRSPVTMFCVVVLLLVPVPQYLVGAFSPHRYRLPFEVVLAIFASAAVAAPWRGEQIRETRSEASV